GGEDAGEAGLEEERRAEQRPALGRAAVVQEVVAGQEVALPASRDDALQPACPWLGPDQHEQRRRGDPLRRAGGAVAYEDRVEPPLALPVHQLDAEADRYVRRLLYLLDQVLRHPLFEAVPADQQ